MFDETKLTSSGTQTTDPSMICDIPCTPRTQRTSFKGLLPKPTYGGFLSKMVAKWVSRYYASK